MKKTRKQLANSTARKFGYGRATTTLPGEKTEIISVTPYGYRKRTTGEYVARAYLRNFGWKNTYYQHSICIVSLSPTDWQKGLETELINKIKGGL